MALTKNDLLGVIHARLSNLNGVDPKTLKPVNLSLTHDQIHAVYQTLVDVTVGELERTGTASLPGLADFKVAVRSARKGHNPATGESIDIPATRVVYAKPVARLRDNASEFALPPAREVSEKQRENGRRLRQEMLQRQQAA